MTNILFFVEAQLCTDLSYLYSSVSFEKEKRKKERVEDKRTSILIHHSSHLCHSFITGSMGPAM